MKSRFYVTALHLNPKGEAISTRPFFETAEDAIDFAQREMSTRGESRGLDSRGMHRHVVEVVALVTPKPVEVNVKRFTR